MSISSNEYNYNGRNLSFKGMKIMRIINKVTDPNYEQWIESFVARVLKRAHIKYNETIIEDIEPSRRVFLLIDNREYTIRTWNYHVIKCDKKNIPCAESVEYTLYAMVEDDSGSHGEIADEGCIKIQWKNEVDA